MHDAWRVRVFREMYGESMCTQAKSLLSYICRSVQPKNLKVMEKGEQYIKYL